MDSIFIFLHPHVTYSILGTNIVHGSLFLNTLSLKHNLLHQIVYCMLCLLIHTNFHFDTFWHPLMPPSGSLSFL